MSDHRDFVDIYPSREKYHYIVISLAICFCFPYPAISKASENISTVEAARFLEKSTLGFDRSDIDHLMLTGYNAWIDEQIGKKPTLNQPYIDYLLSKSDKDRKVKPEELPYHKINTPLTTVGYRNTSSAWLRAVLGGDDHLRQRVAWSLSQIFVVANDSHVLTQATANFYDTILINSFSKFEDLLMAVTLHPMMGRYLSYLGNTKGKGSAVPDENFAREVMQLFSIGLWQLNRDGSLKKDRVTGLPVPTYDIGDVRELAKVFTGLWVQDSRFRRKNYDGFSSPMVMHERHHDKGNKIALGGYLSIDEDQSGILDIRQTISSLAKHPNTAPYMSKRLIQFLVTSNPEPSYVERVVNAWHLSDGNLGLVVKSILLDPVAVDLHAANSFNYGRIKEPIQRFVGILKGFRCGGDTDPEVLPGLQWWNPPPVKMLLQEPFRSPSVFGFFSENYSVQERTERLSAPEFQLLDDVGIAKLSNYLWASIQGRFHVPINEGPKKSVGCDKLSEFKNTKDAIEYANLILAGGRLTHDAQDLILKSVSNGSALLQRVKKAVYSVAIAPESVVQR